MISGKFNTEFIVPLQARSNASTPSTVCSRAPSRAPSSCRSASRSKRSHSSSGRGLAYAELVKACCEPVVWPHPSLRQTQCVCCKLRFAANDVCRQTVCGHTFHNRCLESWFSKHTRCPVAGCRRKFKDCLHTPENIRARESPCDETVKFDGVRPCWSPMYDSELLKLSDRVDSEHRMKVFRQQGWTPAPVSSVFLGADMPVVYEDENDLPWTERQTALPMEMWNSEIWSLNIIFVCSMWIMHWNHMHCYFGAKELCERQRQV